MEVDACLILHDIYCVSEVKLSSSFCLGYFKAIVILHFSGNNFNLYKQTDTLSLVFLLEQYFELVLFAKYFWSTPKIDFKVCSNPHQIRRDVTHSVRLSCKAYNHLRHLFRIKWNTTFQRDFKAVEVTSRTNTTQGSFAIMAKNKNRPYKFIHITVRC